MSTLIGGSTFDSREVIERIEELQSIMEENPHCEGCKDFQYNIDALDEDQAEEWESLIHFRDVECAGVEDFPHGATFIREDYFEEYVKDMLEQLGVDVPGWVAVDWTATADNVRVDYTAVEFDGDTYYVR
jgi:hypothetical protein